MAARVKVDEQAANPRHRYRVSADGAYDTRGCHPVLAAHDARATIPPQNGAIPWSDHHPRDAILKAIETKDRDGWTDDSGYHRPNPARNMMYRLKLRGDKMFSRFFERQGAEAQVRAAILNRFTRLGMPQSIRNGQMPPVT